MPIEAHLQQAAASIHAFQHILIIPDDLEQSGKQGHGMPLACSILTRDIVLSAWSMMKGATGVW